MGLGKCILFTFLFIQMLYSQRKLAFGDKHEKANVQLALIYENATSCFSQEINYILFPVFCFHPPCSLLVVIYLSTSDGLPDASLRPQKRQGRRGNVYIVCETQNGSRTKINNK